MKSSFGFRIACDWARERFDVTPDLTALGKVIGGVAYPWRLWWSQRLMARIAPTGPVYQAGTLSGNPLAPWPRVLPRLACSPRSAHYCKTATLVSGLH
jgi:glutamate-1-semialdehyde aminotransferase